MTIHATLNPIGSTNPKDLIDNAQNIDYLILGPLLSYPDRRGVSRLSWTGIEVSFTEAQAQRTADFNAAQAQRAADYAASEASRGYEAPVPYAAGITLTRVTQLVQYNSELYKAKAGTLPWTTTGVWATDSAKLLSVGDAALRQELSSTTDLTKGASMNGRAVVKIATIAELLTAPRRADLIYQVVEYSNTTGWAIQVPYVGPIGGDPFVWDPANTNPDDGGLVFAVPGVATGRFLRIMGSGFVFTPAKFGARMEGDCYTAITNMLNAVSKQSSATYSFGNNPANLFHCGTVVDFSGRWGTSQQINVPKMCGVHFRDGYLFALDSFTGGGAVISFNTALSSRLTYESCKWDSVTIDARSKADCMYLNRYNRFHIIGQSMFKGAKGWGLYCGAKGAGSAATDGHELFVDGMTFTEFDYWDTRAGSETSIAFEILTNDSHINNWVVSSANIGFILRAKGNRFSDFHIWGCTHKDRAVHIFPSHVGTHMNNFKLGGSKMIIEDPFGIKINDWNAEFTAADFPSDVTFINLRPMGASRSTAVLSIQNGIIEVVGAFANKVYPVQATSNTAGALAYVDVTNKGSGYTTASATVTGDGTGATVAVLLQNGFIRGIQVLTPGSGYTTATVTISGDGTGATATASLLANTGSYNTGAINSTIVKSNGVLGGTAANNISLETHRTLFAGTVAGVERRLSYADKLLFPTNVKVASAILNATGGSNKSANMATSVDAANSEVVLNFYSDTNAATPVSTSGTVSATVFCTSDGF